MASIRSLTALATAFAVVGEVGCAQLAGLPGYSVGESTTDPESSAPVIPIDATVDATSDDVGDEAPSEPDAEGTGEEVEDAEGSATDASSDAGPADGSNGAPDGYACGRDTCGGCCSTTGNCVGGQSVGTCGVGGQACKDCTTSGACTQGTCKTPPHDAGPPPMCVVASCSTSLCAGFPIQGPCCKSDQTCGCQWTVFAPCL
jgi:hypothetical protein